MATIQSWTTFANGDQKPTKRGVSFGQRWYDALKMMIVATSLHKEVAKILKEDMDEDGVKPSLEATRKHLSVLNKQQRSDAWVPCNTENIADAVCTCAADARITKEKWKNVEEPSK